MKLRSAAKALIRRSSDGKYLILRSSEWKENPRRSKELDLPGGEIEEGESIEVGLLRELEEEIGVKVDSSLLQLVQASNFIDETHDISTTFLLYFIETDDIDVTLSWEHEAYEWLDAEAVGSLKIREPYPEIFAHFKRVGLL